MESQGKIYTEFKKGNIMPYEMELIDNLRKVKYQGIPLSILLLSDAMCRYNCYYSSIQLVMGMKHFRLVRGNINAYDIVDYPNHCWVETDEWAYDTSDGFKYRLDVYYELYEPEVIECFDENTCFNDQLYLDFIENSKKEANPFLIECILSSLEYIERLKGSLNGNLLLKEIDMYKKNNPFGGCLNDKKIKLFINECFCKTKDGYSFRTS